MTPDEAMRQAAMTAGDYAIDCTDKLCKILGINKSPDGWQQQLAPFAPVLAAMITAAAQDFETSQRHGWVEGSPAFEQKERAIQQGGDILDCLRSLVDVAKEAELEAIIKERGEEYRDTIIAWLGHLEENRHGRQVNKRSYILENIHRRAPE